MGQNKVVGPANDSENPFSQNPPDPEDGDAGVAALMRGLREDPASVEAIHQELEELAAIHREDRAALRILIRISLVAADILILLLTAWNLVGRDSPLEAGELIFGIVAVCLAAWLGCLAFLLD